MFARVRNLSLATASLIVFMAGSAPLYAQPGPPPAGGTPPMMQGQQGHANAGRMMRGMSPERAVENRITQLHRQLKITPDQEAPWAAVAQVMRDDAKAVEAVATERQTALSTMSAVDNLRSFQRLAQTHAEGLTKLADAFASLYATMSDDQKKNADAVFRYDGRRGMSGRKGPRP